MPNVRRGCRNQRDRDKLASLLAATPQHETITINDILDDETRKAFSAEFIDKVVKRIRRCQSAGRSEDEIRDIITSMAVDAVRKQS